MALDLYGRWAADDSDYNIAEAARAARVRQAVDAHLARSAVAAPVDSADPVEHTDNDTAPRNADSEASSPTRGEHRSVATPVEPVRVLDAALNAAVDDVARAALLAAAPKHVREQLVAGLRYQAFIRETAAPDEYETFDAALAAATTDAARVALLAGRDAAFLAEWARRVRETSDDVRRRYLALCVENEADR